MRKDRKLTAFGQKNPFSTKRKIKNSRDMARAYIEESLNLREGVYFTSQGGNRSKLPEKLVLEEEKTQQNNTVLSFRQYYEGIKVWDSGLVLQFDPNDQLSMASNSLADNLKEKVKPISKEIRRKPEKQITREKLIEWFDLKRNALRLKALKIDYDFEKLQIKVNRVEPVIYEFEKERRQHLHPGEDKQKTQLFSGLPELRLPEVDKSIKDGDILAGLEIHFSTKMPRLAANWRAIVDPETGSVLYVRLLADHLNGFVFDNDPLSETGDASITPVSGAAVLNAVRTPRPLPGLTITGSPQALSGNYVYLDDLYFPAIAAPTTPGSDFNYDADTDDFSAVNAYYHSDGVFRMVEEMGFDMSTYFNGTLFPVPVDHRGFFGCVNACAPGNALGNGSGGFSYGLVSASGPVGIAACRRIVLHEFGHAVLWDNVWSPNLGFAHSVGDSLAAVLSDPKSKAPDRFLTFPWLTASNPGIDRRHDRDVTAGWAFNGSNDDGGYGAEQILATAHFRLYRSLGGDAEAYCERDFASRYTAFLILKSVSFLTPLFNPASSEDWEKVMESADFSTKEFEGHPGRLTHKVIRWAFEKQGSFHPVSTPLPITSEGPAPSIDIYINDGRDGAYPYSEDVYRSDEIWNRNSPDGGAAHQKPKIGQENYAYVTIRNRGTKSVKYTLVNGYHLGSCCCEDSAVGDKLWPNDFKPMTTSIWQTGPIVSGGYAIAGPFKWTPRTEDDVLVFTCTTKGDQANEEYLTPEEQVVLRHIAPFDNNMAVRALCSNKPC
ncbi:MAG: hypothetical protein GYB31_16465 [Bacteroidetes bacterium]|nr:hypothetical protein [Bacteroidota bacterium]